MINNNLMTDNRTINIYTDGAASGNPGPGGYACVIIKGDNIIEKVGGEKFTTNNRMELMAVIIALEASLEDKNEKIMVYSDSTYVVKAIKEGWLQNWLAINFKKKKNEDLWRRFYQAYIQFKNIDFAWVHGHNGNFYNERCDKLARNFSKTLQS